MCHPDFIACCFVENSIGPKRIKKKEMVHCLRRRDTGWIVMPPIRKYIGKCGLCNKQRHMRQFMKKCTYRTRTGPEVIKLFPCSTQLSTKFILLINVKMPTIVSILTFNSMINTTSKRLKARNFFVCRYFSFYEQLKFRAQLS